MTFAEFPGFLHRLTVVIANQRYRFDDMAIAIDGINAVFGHSGIHSHDVASRGGFARISRLLDREQPAIFDVQYEATGDRTIPALCCGLSPAVVVAAAPVACAYALRLWSRREV
jgi:hypothetical protein